MSETTIIKNNFSDKKNILLLVGNLRTIEYLFKYHKKFLKNTKSDLAISTWDDDSCNDDLIQKIIKELKPIYLDIEDYNFNLTANIFGNLNKFDLLFGKAALSTRFQVYKFVRTVKLINELEKLQNKKYQIIFKSRPDLLCYSKIDLKIKTNEIIFENTFGDWSRDRSDRFFYAHRNEFLRLIDSFKNNAKKAWDEKSMYPVLHLIPLQEQYIKYCCNRDNFFSKPFLPIIKVWRPLKEPNIKDLSKIIIHKFKRIFLTLIR